MEKKEKVIIKPPFWLTIQLFLFMMLIIYKMLGLYDYFQGNYGNAYFEADRLLLQVSSIIDLLLYCYALIAIYKALQHKPYSIIMLKLSVFYVMMQMIVIAIKRMYYLGSSLAILFLPIIGLCLILFVYLFKSKRIKQFIPIKKRKYGLWGWLGWLIYLMVLGFNLFFMYDKYKYTHNSKPIPVSQVKLNKNEITDGLVAFTPLKDWNKVKVVGSEETGFSYVYNSEECYYISISSFVSNTHFSNRLDYYNLVIDSYNCNFYKGKPIKEVYYITKNLGNNKIFSNSYLLYTQEQDSIYWTFSALLDCESNKILTINNVEKNSYTKSLEIASSLFEKVRFHLKE